MSGADLALRARGWRAEAARIELASRDLHSRTHALAVDFAPLALIAADIATRAAMLQRALAGVAGES